jgi:hypothetical protein
VSTAVLALACHRDLDDLVTIAVVRLVGRPGPELPAPDPQHGVPVQDT